MYPIIVLEGPDGAGKTTLANEIAKWNGGKYLHLTYRFKDRMFDYHTAAIELAAKYAEQQPVILDRWWPSEKIYADVFRGGSKWPLGGRLLDRVALKLGVTYVMCFPRFKNQHLEEFEKLKASGREMYETVDKVYDEYVKLWAQLEGRPDWLYYDIQSHGKNLVDYAQYVIDRATDNFESQPVFWRERTNKMVAGTGDSPAILFVGDQSKPKTRRDIWPFFEYGNSSLWFTEKLEEFDIPEHKLAWVNAHNARGEVDPLLHATIRNINPQRIVTLGDNAHRAVRDLGYQTRVYQLRHPQYYRRFNRETSDIKALKALVA